MLKIGRAPQLLPLCALWLSLAFAPVNAAPGKAKPDQARPKPKVLTSQLKLRVPEHKSKGKKGFAAKPEAAKAKAPENTKAGKAAEQKLAAKAGTTARPREQDAKLKSKSRAKEEPLPTKAVNKPGRAANREANREEDRPLASRLVAASFASPQRETERRGKFGKESTRSTRAAERDDDQEVVAVARPRPRETTRAPERELERGNDRAEATPARRPREANPKSNPASGEPDYPIQMPDKIEVVEYGSGSPTIAKLLTLPETRPLTPFGAVVTKGNAPPSKRNDLAIPPERVLEIQYELVKRGFYNAEPNGVYDEATILAMWEFQKNYGLPATGYPTAHALRRLGLTSW